MENSTAKDISGKIFEQVTNQPLPANPNTNQLADINTAISGASPSDVIAAVVGHLGLSTDLTSAAETFIADRLKGLAEKVDTALNEREAAFQTREAQFFLYVHQLLARVGS